MLAQDADFVIECSSEPLTRLTAYLGAAFRLDPQMTFETATMSRRHVLTVVGVSPVELFYLSDDPHDRERFSPPSADKNDGPRSQHAHGRGRDYHETALGVDAGRSKDREDVRDVIAVQGQNIDWPYIHGWCDQHGTASSSMRSVAPFLRCDANYFWAAFVFHGRIIIRVGFVPAFCPRFCHVEPRFRPHVDV